MGVDAAMAREGLSVGVSTGMGDVLRGTTHWLVERWDVEAVEWMRRRIGFEPAAEDFRQFRVAPYEVSEVAGNLITNAGWTRLMTLLTGGAGQALDEDHVRIGVGNGTTSEAYTDADLAAASGSTNRYFQPVSAAGSLGTRTLTFQASFGASNGNFAWNEFCLDVTSGTAAGGTTVGALLFNRKAGISQGTKASGQVWSASAQLTFT